MDLDRIVLELELAASAHLSPCLKEVCAANVIGLATFEQEYVFQKARGTITSYQGIVVDRLHARSRHDLSHLWLVAQAADGQDPLGQILAPYKDRLDDVFHGRVRAPRSK